MKWYWVLVYLPITTSILFGNRKLTKMDKQNIKKHVDPWIELWKKKPNPLSQTRINEAWKSVIWCSNYKLNELYYCFSYKNNQFFILAIENETSKTLNVAGVLESPNNIYEPVQTKELHEELNLLANGSNYTISYSLLRNWSHGFYFYEYQSP